MGTLSLRDYEDVRIWAPWGHIAGRWYGNRTERPLLAIHGWLDNLGSFDTLIPQLPDYLGVLCIDLPGHGCSAPFPPGQRYSTFDYVLIIARVMKEYNWPKVSLMGHSLGGVLCFIYATLLPHRVDMIITLDIVLPPLESIEFLSWRTEKVLVEDEHFENSLMREPPSYSLDQLRDVLSKGTRNSVSPEEAKHLLYRGVTKSDLYPDKFYFSRDGRTKYYNIFIYDYPLVAEMARRIKNKPYLVIKGSDSPFVGPRCNEVISILKKQNPHFELHEATGSHHVHLTNAKDCAQYIVPFLRRHRPPALATWSLTGEETNLSKREHRKAQESFFARNKKRRSKL